MIVATVLRSGGDFAPKHVRALREQVLARWPEARFVCLSDVDVEGVETLPFSLDPPPGYWAKVEVFRRTLFQDDEHVVYLDLDMLLLGRLEEVFRHEGRDVIALRGGRYDNLASALLSFRHPDLRWVYNEYAADPEGTRARFTGSFSGRQGRVGDQALIEHHLGEHWVAAQDLQRGIYRYKREIAGDRKLPSDAQLIVFNGNPRPWQLDLPWVPDYEAYA